MNILGLDLSLTAPGLCTQVGPALLRVPKFEKGMESQRLEWFYEWTHDTCKDIDLVVIENYAFGAKFQREALAELGGVVRLALFQLAIPYVAVAPATLKKYATGNGKANKDEMLSAAITRSGLAITNNNAADAWWLYQMGADAHELPNAIQMPKENRKSLEKLKWLDLEGNK